MVFISALVAGTTITLKAHFVPVAGHGGDDVVRQIRAVQLPLVGERPTPVAITLKVALPPQTTV